MARLRRTSPSQPGWTRRRAGRGFVYLDAGGDRLPEAEVERIRALVIPPAWREVWICPDERGHLQAVGIDDAGRKQYLYHPDWRAHRDRAKFERVRRLGEALPRARRRVEADLALEGVPLERACAAATRLLDLGCFRIGNDVYADENGGFGLTSLERRHVRRRGDALVFDFVGKSGVEHHVEIADAEAVRVIEEMRRRRGDTGLLAFRDGRGWRRVTPQLVNEYLREVTGLDVTAKDFRTWHATVVAAASLAETGPAPTGTARARAVRRAMAAAAELLGNSPALARSAYVDPAVIDAYEDGRTIARRGSAERQTLRLVSSGRSSASR